jgi:Mg2+ and Co2+ transporter CorA
VTLHGDNGNADGDTWIEMDDLDKAKHHQQSLTGHHLRQRGANAGRKAADIISGLRGRDGKVNDIPTEYLSGFAYRQSEKWTPWRLAVLYFKLFFLPVTDARESPHQSMGSKDSDLFDRSTMLRSMTNMRRLVTGLSRLLVGKHAVVASLLKRAHESRAGGDDEAYLSDVADHILLLQTSLYHYEYILSHCQPAYLSYLNVSSAQSRGGTDVLILTLSTVSIGILPMQLFIGMFSMNIKVPHNGLREGTHLEPDGSVAPHNYFAGICVGIFFIGCGLVLVVRWWRWLARKKWTELRGGELPPTWDGFWGWY